MKKKLYHVQITIDTVVAAHDAESAKQAAYDHLEDIVENDCCFDMPEAKVIGRIVEKKDLPKGWTDPCLPYGGEKDGDAEYTVEDYL